MQGKVISCIKPLLYLGKKRQASGRVSLTSESVFKAKRKVERSSSGLTGAVNQIIWAQQFFTTAERKHTAYWEGENTEWGRCWDGAPFLSPRSSFPTALSYREAPYIIVLQVPRSMPNKKQRGKNQWSFLSLWLFQRNSMSVTLQVSVSMTDGCVCTLPLNYTQYPITALLLCSLESLWNKTGHQRTGFASCISNTKDASVGHSSTCLLLLLAHRKRSCGMPWRSLPTSLVQACSYSLP